MKNLLIIVLTAFSICTINAQLKNKVFNKDLRKSTYTSSTKLNLEILKKDLQTQNRFFNVTISMAALTKNYKKVFPTTGYALEQSIYWEQATKTRGYFRVNGGIKRSKSFTRTNYFEVLINPTLRDPSKVGLVKITWRSNELGLNTFNLENVNVTYHQEGILINGVKTIKGYPMGVTIAICSKK